MKLATDYALFSHVYKKERLVNKMLIAAGVVAIGAGGFFYVENQSNSSASILNQVPADTAILAAQLTPTPLEYYLSSIANMPSHDDMLALMETEPANVTKKQQFFLSFYDSFLAAVESPAQFKATFGTSDTINNYFYTLGFIPVIKMEVEKPTAFWATMDKIEAESQFVHTKNKLGTVDYRSYSLVEQDGVSEVELIIAITDGFATITVNVPKLDELNPLKMALGIEQPTHSVASENIINNIKTKHPTISTEHISYFDHQQIAKGITTVDGNLLAKQITKMNQIEGSDSLGFIQTPACQNDIQSIATNWPRTVAGGSFHPDGKITGNFIIESNNKVILDALQSLRGFIPQSDLVKQSALFFGLGMDVNQLTPAVTNILSDVQSVPYQCQPLAQFQQEMKQANPAMMIGMASGFINGLKGISFSLFDYGFAQGEYSEELTKLDAAITLSADNPAALVQNAAMMIPELASIQIPTDGTPFELPAELVGMLGDIAPAYAVAKANHLSIYTGKQAAKFSQDLLDKPIEKNGMTEVFIDYNKLFSPILTMLEESGEPIPEELEAFIQNDLNASMTYDVTDKGISVSVTNLFIEK